MIFLGLPASLHLLKPTIMRTRIDKNHGSEHQRCMHWEETCLRKFPSFFTSNFSWISSPSFWVNFTANASTYSQFDLQSLVSESSSKIEMNKRLIKFKEQVTTIEIAFSTSSLFWPSMRPLMYSKASLSFFNITCPSKEATSFNFAYNIT